MMSGDALESLAVCRFVKQATAGVLRFRSARVNMRAALTRLRPFFLAFAMAMAASLSVGELTLLFCW